MVVEVDGQRRERDVDPPAGDYGDFYVRVRDVLREGGPMPVSAEEGAAVVRVIEAAHRSAREEAVVKP